MVGDYGNEHKTGADWDIERASEVLVFRTAGVVPQGTLSLFFKGYPRETTLFTAQSLSTSQRSAGRFKLIKFLHSYIPKGIGGRYGNRHGIRHL